MRQEEDRRRMLEKRGGFAEQVPVFRSQNTPGLACLLLGDLGVLGLLFKELSPGRVLSRWAWWLWRFRKCRSLAPQGTTRDEHRTCWNTGRMWACPGLGPVAVPWWWQWMEWEKALRAGKLLGWILLGTWCFVSICAGAGTFR